MLFFITRCFVYNMNITVQGSSFRPGDYQITVSTVCPTYLQLFRSEKVTLEPALKSSSARAIWSYFASHQ